MRRYEASIAHVSVSSNSGEAGAVGVATDHSKRDGGATSRHDANPLSRSVLWWLASCLGLISATIAGFVLGGACDERVWSNNFHLANMGHLLMLRHGESQWNLEDRFTGWIDVPLSDRGRDEANVAAQRLKGYRVDRTFTSSLVRATDAVRIVLAAIGQEQIPIEENQALNERMYGYLQGLNKEASVEKYGAERVEIWRRSDEVRPPGGESLRDTATRVLPYYEERIKPALDEGDTVLLVAHGNSLRALVMHLESLSPEQIVALSIPTATLLIYGVDDKGKVALVR